MKRKRTSYKAGFKLKVVEYVHGNSNAMQEYDEPFGESDDDDDEEFQGFKLLSVCLRMNLLVPL